MTKTNCELWCDRFFQNKRKDDDPVPYKLEESNGVKLFVVKPLFWADHVNTPVANPTYHVWANDHHVFSCTDYITAYKKYERESREALI